MACGGCAARSRALVSSAQNIARGNMRAAGQNLSFVGRTFVQDARNGSLRAETVARLNQLRNRIKPK